jgi:hypothetical protein
VTDKVTEHHATNNETGNNHKGQAGGEDQQIADTRIARFVAVFRLFVRHAAIP